MCVCVAVMLSLLCYCHVFSTIFLKNFGRGESLVTTTCLKTVVGVNKGMLPVKYFCYDKVSFLCLSNFFEICYIDGVKSGHPQFWGYYQI